MKLVFTMPGKIGDALHQWPVVYHYCKQNKATCELWLDEGTLGPLVNLFKAQPCVEEVKLIPGITSYHQGGQPWDFGLGTEAHQDQQIVHLGMRSFPTRQITLQTLNDVPLKLGPIDHDEPTLETGIGPMETRKTLCLHGTFQSHTSGTPGFWRFLSDRWDEICEDFWPVFVGSADERARAQELYLEAATIDDQGDFLKLAQWMSASCCGCIGAGSSVVVLASQLKIPTIRVHDDIGGHPRQIWDNLGPGQLNRSEIDLRKEWPAWRDEFLGAKVV